MDDFHLNLPPPPQTTGSNKLLSRPTRLPPPPPPINLPPLPPNGPLQVPPTRLPPAPPKLVNLPNEVLEKIILELPAVRGINHLCQTNSDFYQLCKSDAIWKKLVQRDFGVTRLDTNKVDSWKTLYQILSVQLYIGKVAVEDMGSADYPVLAVPFLDLEQAIDWIIKIIELNGDLFHLNTRSDEINIQILPGADQIDPGFLDIISAGYKQLLENVDRSANPTWLLTQLNITRKVVHAFIREYFHDPDNTELIGESNPDSDTYYNIEIENITPPVVKDDKQKYEFFLTNYSDDKQLYGSRFHKYSLSEILEILLHYFVKIESDSIFIRFKPKPVESFSSTIKTRIRPLGDASNFIQFVRQNTPKQNIVQELPELK